MRERALSEREGIAAVARHYSAILETHDATAQASLSIGGRQVAVDAAILRSPAQGETSKVRLRLDKVVVRVIERLRAALNAIVPEGVVVLFTMTAPIRLAARTIEALEGAIRAQLSRSAVSADWTDEINGNQIRVRLRPVRSLRTSRLIGFVHNPETDAEMPLDLAEALFEAFDSLDRAKGSPNERWLLLLCDSGTAPLRDWRQVWAQLGVRTDYARILMVLEGGRVEILEG